MELLPTNLRHVFSLNSILLSGGKIDFTTSHGELITTSVEDHILNLFTGKRKTNPCRSPVTEPQTKRRKSQSTNVFQANEQPPKDNSIRPKVCEQPSVPRTTPKRSSGMGTTEPKSNSLPVSTKSQQPNEIKPITAVHRKEQQQQQQQQETKDDSKKEPDSRKPTLSEGKTSQTTNEALVRGQTTMEKLEAFCYTPKIAPVQEEETTTTTTEIQHKITLTDVISHIVPLRESFENSEGINNRCFIHITC
jgi:hypothetical protein